MEVLYMPCYHPLKAWPVGINPDTGKTSYKVTPYNVLDFEGKTGDCIEIPCGKCRGCRLRYSREWADRCLIESQYHFYNYFITLTYDDEHVPISSYYDDDDNLIPSLTLCKRDVQLFFKRLRKAGMVFRYYCCGEYGDSTFRPHYHLLMFADTPLTDLREFSFRRGNWFYTSDFLEKKWQNGNVLIGDLTWESAAYTARYVMKKLGGPAAEDYKLFGLEPEFVVMSRQPGIASMYYEEHMREIYLTGEINIATPNGGKKLKPSRYYDRLFDLDYPEMMRDIKQQRRQSAEVARELKLKQTDLDWGSYLLVEEENLISRTKKLIRGDF